MLSFESRLMSSLWVKGTGAATFTTAVIFTEVRLPGAVAGKGTVFICPCKGKMQVAELGDAI